MLRNILLLSLGLFAFSSQAQIDKQLRIGIDAQYDFPFGDGYNCFYGYPVLWNDVSQSLYSYKRYYFSTGATIRYGLTEQIELGSGIYFSRKEVSNVYYYGCFTPYPAEVYVPNYNNFLEIPLTARFYTLPGKFKLHMELGQKIGLNINTFRGNDSDSYRYCLMGGAGINYFLNRFQFTLSANYSRQLNLGYDVNNVRNNLGISLNTSFSIGRN